MPSVQHLVLGDPLDGRGSELASSQVCNGRRADLKSWWQSQGWHPWLLAAQPFIPWEKQRHLFWEFHQPSGEFLAGTLYIILCVKVCVNWFECPIAGVVWMLSSYIQNYLLLLIVNTIELLFKWWLSAAESFRQTIKSKAKFGKRAHSETHNSVWGSSLLAPFPFPSLSFYMPCHCINNSRFILIWFFFVCFMHVVIDWSLPSNFITLL